MNLQDNLIYQKIFSASVLFFGHFPSPVPEVDGK